MTSKDFRKSVKAMRAAQKRFFAAPYKSEERQAALVAARIAEKIVDEEIDRLERADETASLFEMDAAVVYDTPDLKSDLEAGVPTDKGGTLNDEMPAVRPRDEAGRRHQ